MTSKLFEHLPALCNVVRRIAVEAGDATLSHFDESGCAHDTKGDGSPVTIADREAEAIIERALKEIDPDIPFIAEEAADAGRCGVTKIEGDFWLVDPLDGTKEFISGSGDYTVNIALVRGGVPVLGVVYAPVRGELYAAHGPDTAVRWSADTHADKSIRVRTPPKAGLTVVASKNHSDGPAMDRFLECLKIEKTLKRGSSLKLCAVASGKADLYPRFGRTCGWDIAAGQAVVMAAGGVVADLSGTPLTYGRGENWENPGFLAHAGMLDFTEALTE
jgi:3'(2'), 5'-bisphosphate nucleotidase